MLTERVVDESPRPEFISAVTDAFNLYLKADDMEPRYERGDRLLVNPSLPLIVDKDVLILSEKDASGQQRGLVRRLLSFTDDHWRVKCHNPLRVHSLSRKDWPTAIRVEASRAR
jgi:phage repressor protein C with HTH and peptisase S24 domain